MERRYQVFISSTYTDLVDERREVIQALLEMDCLPAGMEMFPAANEDQWTLIQEVIDQSDYYLVVVGGRYGSTTEEGISYTEKEYEYATAQGIPVMGFVHAKPDEIPVGKTDIDAAARARLDAFRAKVMTRMVKTYESPSDLGSVVSRGLNRLIKRNPRPGWVRGDQAMTPETRTEIAELRAALANLEKTRAEEEVVLSKEEHKLDLSFQHGDDKIELKLELSGDESYRSVTYSGELIYRWDEVIEVLGPYMIDESPEPQLRRILNSHMMEQIFENPEGWPELDNPTVKVSDASWGSVIVQLRALGMIRTGVKKRTVSDKAVYWTLTPAGDDYLIGLRAVKRTA
jgi:hypothetical protein